GRRGCVQENHPAAADSSSISRWTARLSRRRGRTARTYTLTRLGHLPRGLHPDPGWPDRQGRSDRGHVLVAPGTWRLRAGRVPSLLVRASSLATWLAAHRRVPVNGRGARRSP